MKPDKTEIGNWTERVNQMTGSSLQDALIELAALVEDARTAFERFGPVAEELSHRMSALEDLFVEHDSRAPAGHGDGRTQISLVKDIPAASSAAD
jgi:hypothetical protein